MRLKISRQIPRGLGNASGPVVPLRPPQGGSRSTVSSRAEVAWALGATTRILLASLLAALVFGSACGSNAQCPTGSAGSPCTLTGDLGQHPEVPHTADAFVSEAAPADAPDMAPDAAPAGDSSPDTLDGALQGDEGRGPPGDDAEDAGPKPDTADVSQATDEADEAVASFDASLRHPGSRARPGGCGPPSPAPPPA